MQDYQAGQAQRWRKTMALLSVSLVILFVVSLGIGSVSIPIGDIINVLTGGAASKNTWTNIIINFRLPKSITALLVGAGLSVSGLQMQTFFRNPLAGPFVLGISSGASLGVALAIMAGVSLGIVSSALSSWYLVIAATLGASLVLLLVVAVSIRIKDSMSLLIIGLMFGSVTGAVVSVLQYFSSAQNIQAYLVWTFGSLGGMNPQELMIFIPVVLAGILIAFVLAKSLNALLLGENYAQSMGLNINSVRLWVILSTSLLAGGITAFTGPIAFIGIAVPHLSRMLFNTSDHRLLIPLTCLVGAILMLVCDMIAQVPGSEHLLPINAITSMFGAPVVIWLILRKKNLRSSFGA